MNILVLIVGSNPLPNYVVINYLLNENREDKVALPVPDKIIRIESNGTKKFSKLIKMKSKNDHRSKFITPVNLGDSQRNGKKIKDAISEYLTSFHSEEEISSIHLNYTGGTKPMAVHSYQAIKSFCGEEIKTIYSDLDPSTHSLKVDDNKGCAEKYYPVRDEDLRDYVNISVKNLLELHSMGIKKENPTNKIVDEMNFNDFLEEAFLRNPKMEWRNQILYIKDEYERKAKKKAHNPMSVPPLTTKDIRNFATNYNQINNELNHMLPDFNIIKPIEFKQLVDWLHGGWLEDYVANLFKNIDGAKITEVKKSVEAKSVEGNAANLRECEIDVVIMQGYHMTLVSCTTSQRIKTVKQKAFEALYRAEQLGGDHSNVIVVSLMKNQPRKGRNANFFEKENNLQQLKKDLSSFDARMNKQISLIGLEDLKNPEQLKEKLNFILSQKG